MFRPQQQKLLSLIGEPIAPLIDLDVFAAPHVWQRQTGCDSSTRPSWLRQIDRQTHLPADRPSVSLPPPPSPPQQHLHCVTHLTLPHPTQLATRAADAPELRVSPDTSVRCARPDGREEPQQRRTQWEWLGRTWWALLFLFAPLLNCAFWRLGVCVWHRERHRGPAAAENAAKKVRLRKKKNVPDVSTWNSKRQFIQNNFSHLSLFSYLTNINFHWCQSFRQK